MKLLIDIGNTNIVYGISEGMELKKKWRTSYNLKFTKDEFAISIINYLNYFNLKPDCVNISCVVPEVLFAIKNGIEEYLHIKPKIVDCNIKCGLDIPNELGADRIVNCIAANKIYGSDLIIIDFGTATTYDMLDASGKFLTGITAPGLKISAEALFNKASLLSATDLVLPKSIFVKNTTDSVRAGIILSHIGAAEYIIKKLLEQLPNAKVIATGGLCSLIDTDLINIQDSDLTLKGLMLID